jgi:hypothetical protein
VSDGLLCYIRELEQGDNSKVQVGAFSGSSAEMRDDPRVIEHYLGTWAAAANRRL